CTPCREGTRWSVEMLERIKAGTGRLRDLDLLLEIGDTIGIIPGTTICGLADGAAWPIKNAIRKFRQEFEDFIRRTNPSGYDKTEAVLSLDPRGNSHSDVIQIAPWWPEASHHG
ncbi:MAG: NADH-ubiquinone oxidoreductase-F iron-sulfur binding region domain-containing protein, partial [Pirellulales bacterium]